MTTAKPRTWIVVLYFYLAALVGLVFVLTGATKALFGAKELALPELGVSAVSTYDYNRRDAQGNPLPFDERYRDESRANDIANRRREGANDLIDGGILLIVGTPTLVWHLRRTRRIGAMPEQLAPEQPPAD